MQSVIRTGKMKFGLEHYDRYSVAVLGIAGPGPKSSLGPLFENHRVYLHVFL